MSIESKKTSLVKLILLTILIPVANIVIHTSIFVFLRDVPLNPALYALLAIIWGVFGIYTVYWSLNWLVEQYPDKVRSFLQPYIFIGPVALLLGWLLLLPTLRTIYLSFFGSDSTEFVGIANYIAVFTDRLLLTAFRNNCCRSQLALPLSSIDVLIKCILIFYDSIPFCNEKIC